MNIVFFGSANFALPALEALLKGQYNISCVVTQPDRQKGRGLMLAPTAVKTKAIKAGLKVYQPKQVNAEEALNFLKSLRPDLFVVVAYGQILSPQILNIPSIFSINAHASLLPKYRGAAPINWSMINGERVTGVTIIKITKEMDAGPVLLRREVKIEEDDTAISLEIRLAKEAAGLLMQAISAIQKKSYQLLPQGEAGISLAPKLQKKDGLIEWKNSASRICALVKGCLPWPVAFTYYKGKLLKIFKVKVYPLACLPAAVSCGEICAVNKDGIIVATGEGGLIIEELQIEGKRRMKATEFAAGHKIRPKDTLG